MTAGELMTSKMMVEETVVFKGNQSNKTRIWLIIFALIAVIILIVGIVLIVLAIKKKEDATDTDEHASSSFCEYSEEAKRIGLDDFMKRVKKTYYDKHPFMLPGDPDATREDIKEKYSAYNPTPDYIKEVTDTALNLYKEAKEIKVVSDKLKPRERKALSQLKHYLKTLFGQPFDMNFYAGDWMMGPTFYCSKQTICNVGKHLQGMLARLKPKNAKDVELIKSKLKTHKEGILRYMENLKMGKIHGMVYSQEACVAGWNGLKRKYLKIALKNETGKNYLTFEIFDIFISDAQTGSVTILHFGLKRLKVKLFCESCAIFLKTNSIVKNDQEIWFITDEFSAKLWDCVKVLSELNTSLYRTNKI